jgi:hypothetical protein
MLKMLEANRLSGQKLLGGVLSGRELESLELTSYQFRKSFSKWQLGLYDGWKGGTKYKILLEQ